MKYGESESPEEKQELSEYWRIRRETEAAEKKEASLCKKRKRERRSSRVYYMKVKTELREAKKEAWHTARRLGRERREAAKKLAEASVLCKALGLKTDEEIKVFITIRELIPAQVVHLLAAQGYIKAEHVEPALVYLVGKN